MLVGKERLLYSRGQQPVEKVDWCPEGSSPLPIMGQELLRGVLGGTGREGAACVTAQSAPVVILKLVMGGLISVTWRFHVQLVSAPGSFVPISLRAVLKL